jgi:hypothetical protein
LEGLASAAFLQGAMEMEMEVEVEAEVENIEHAKVGEFV